MNALRARCAACGHSWSVGELPAEVNAFLAHLQRQATQCPDCGSGSVYAQQMRTSASGVPIVRKPGAWIIKQECER